MSTAVVFPGQGSQYVGMGMDFLENQQAEWFNKVCEKTDLDLRKLIRDGPAEDLEDTRVTQPAVFIVNHLVYRYILEHSDIDPDFFAGHSLGEYNALVAAGWVGFDELLPVVVTRGRAMGEAADRVDGGMAALLRIDLESARTLCEDISNDPDIDGTVQVALYNSPDQLVISGARPALDRAIEAARDAGALKSVELDVSGPWHSQYMEPAVSSLEEVLDDIRWTSGETVVTNVSAEILETTPEDDLLDQLTEPVRWTQSVERLLEAGVRKFIEVGPGDALKGMIERITKQTDYDVDVYNTDTLDNTRDTIEAI